MKKTLNKFIPLAYGAYFNALALFSKEQAAKKAFELFCTPRKGRVLPFQADYLDQVKHQTVEAVGHQLQTYKWHGNGATVLLLHGWESNTYRWRNLAAKLKREGYTIVAFDAPAHGYSSGRLLNVPIYTECTKAIIATYSPNYVVGHSVGGLTSVYSQYKYPDSSVEKIVSIGAPSELSEIMASYQNIVKFNDSVLEGLDAYLHSKYGFRIEDFSVSQYAKQVKKKGLLVHDRHDRIAPFHASEKVHANWKDSELFVTEGLGHSLHQDEVNEKIIDFLKS